MRELLVVTGLAALTLGACGGSQAEGPGERSSARVSFVQNPHETVKPEPLEVDVQAKRFGAALRLDITGTGRGRLEGERFEDPDAWQVEVVQNGARLQRAVNGPVKVARNPVGRASGARWDVVVRFSVNFVMEEDDLPLVVMVEAPDEEPTKVTISRL